MHHKTHKYMWATSGRVVASLKKAKLTRRDVKTLPIEEVCQHVRADLDEDGDTRSLYLIAFVAATC
jgi:hypothetical protein